MARDWETLSCSNTTALECFLTRRLKDDDWPTIEDPKNHHPLPSLDLPIPVFNATIVADPYRRLIYFFGGQLYSHTGFHSKLGGNEIQCLVYDNDHVTDLPLLRSLTPKLPYLLSLVQQRPSSFLSTLLYPLSLWNLVADYAYPRAYLLPCKLSQGRVLGHGVCFRNGKVWLAGGADQDPKCVTVRRVPRVYDSFFELDPLAITTTTTITATLLGVRLPSAQVSLYLTVTEDERVVFVKLSNVNTLFIERQDALEKRQLDSAPSPSTGIIFNPRTMVPSSAMAPNCRCRFCMELMLIH